MDIMVLNTLKKRGTMKPCCEVLREYAGIQIYIEVLPGALQTCV